MANTSARSSIEPFCQQPCRNHFIARGGILYSILFVLLIFYFYFFETNEESVRSTDYCARTQCPSG